MSKTNSIQRIANGLVSSGTYTLAFGTDAPFTLNSFDPAATIQAALQSSSSVGSGNAVVAGELDTGGIWITFVGALSGTAVPLIAIDTSGLSCPGSIGDVTETTAGVAKVLQVVRWDFSSDIGNSISIAFLPPGGAVPFTPDGTDADDQSALDAALNSIDPGISPSVAVSGSVATITVDPSTFSAANLSVSSDSVNQPSTTTDYVAPVAEVQTIPAPNATGGTFTVDDGSATNTPVAWNITQAGLQTALNALPNITSEGGVVVSGTDGGPWIVTWNNPGPQSLLTVNGAGLLAVPQATVTSLQDGGQTIGGGANARRKVGV